MSSTSFVILILLLLIFGVFYYILRKWFMEARSLIKGKKDKKNDVAQDKKISTSINHPKASRNVWVYPIFLGLFIWFCFGGGLEKYSDKQMQEITNKVADDAVKMYNIAKREGDPINICVQASSVTAAYLLAKDEPNYRNWKQIERVDCNRAGLER